MSLIGLIYGTMRMSSIGPGHALAHCKCLVLTQSAYSAPINMPSRVIADALRPVFEAPEVSVSVTAQQRFPLHVPPTQIRELQ